MEQFGDRHRATAPARASFKALVLVGFACFAVGALLVGWLWWQNRDALFGQLDAVQQAAPAAADTPAPLAAPRPSPTPDPAATADAAVARVAQQQGGIEQRLAAAEQRLARLDLQAQAASGNAARAEGLLIAFATRRSLSRGAELGYLADQLRLRFGDALPNAVSTVIAFSRDPVTLDQLIARLDGLAPRLADPAEQNLIERVRREVGSLLVIRRESTPSPQPRQRMERARYFLESGRVDRAIEEVRGLPGATNANAWIRDAGRYRDTQRALDLIETAAVLEPRRLRDSSGNPVELPGPAG